ncbi:hypothetical protein, partial [Tepidicaulis marinus]|uniref:hypothetical protein n=1 Tax=Tepidicaulis marinus TaxID=1333998 RepID=UPI001AEBED76
HLQIVRNASAHWNSETKQEIGKILSRYKGPSILHPTDLCFATVLNSPEFAFVDWIDELKMLSTIAAT